MNSSLRWLAERFGSKREWLLFVGGLFLRFQQVVKKVVDGLLLVCGWLVGGSGTGARVRVGIAGATTENTAQALKKTANFVGGLVGSRATTTKIAQSLNEIPGSTAD